MGDVSKKIRLHCWLQGDAPDCIFSVFISLNDTVYDLKEAILAELQPMDAALLQLWKVVFTGLYCCATLTSY